MDSKSIRLTQTVTKGGCAAKLPAGELKSILGQLQLRAPRELVLGAETLDDACLWDLGDGRLLVQTLDFFTPMVDDPYDFGAVAAANALSDVYAMGGEPKTALAILAFPLTTLPLEVLEPLMRGAVDKIQESGAALAGGHSIDDETLKFGFSVSGFVPASEVWTNAGAREGDVLVLTKGLGTGTIMSALKSGDAREEWVHAAVSSMKTLNRVPELLRGVKVHAATDITGFGLAGHSLQMAEASGVRFEIDVGNIPVLPGALDSLREDNTNRAHVTNRKYVEARVDWERIDPAISEVMRLLVCDAQTSGGLLLAVSKGDADRVVQCLRERFPLTAAIGRVEAYLSGPRVVYR